MLIHTNNAPYSPNTLNSGSPKQANQASGKGFFTAPQRQVSGKLVRSTRASYSKDYWSQPRQFYNSLLPEEQQFLINAIRFEASQLQSETVKRNVLNQLNKIHNGIASKVAETLGMPAPKADSTFYHDRTFKDVSTFATPLKKLHGLKVGILTTNKAIDTATINNIRNALKPEGVSVVVVAESLAPGVDQTYSASDAIQFDGVIIAKGASALFASATKASSPLFPAGRPVQILIDSYRYGKPVGFAGDAASVQSTHSIPSGPGVYVEGAVTPVPGQAAFAGKAAASGKSSGKDRNRVAEDLPISQETLEKRAEAAAADLAGQFKEGLKQFRFLNRFPVEK
jgi:catalase